MVPTWIRLISLLQLKSDKLCIQCHPAALQMAQGAAE